MPKRKEPAPRQSLPLISHLTIKQATDHSRTQVDPQVAGRPVRICTKNKLASVADRLLGEKSDKGNISVQRRAAGKN